MGTVLDAMETLKQEQSAHTCTEEGNAGRGRVTIWSVMLRAMRGTSFESEENGVLRRRSSKLPCICSVASHRGQSPSLLHVTRRMTCLQLPSSCKALVSESNDSSWLSESCSGPHACLNHDVR